MSAGSGNQQSKTQSSSAQNTASASGTLSSPVNASGGSIVSSKTKGDDNSTKVGTGAVVQAAGAANIALSKGSTYSPDNSSTTNITGIDPTAALDAIGQLQLNNAGSATGSGGTTVVTSASPDLSGLGDQISSTITGALGLNTDSATTTTSKTLYWIGGGILLLVLALLFFRRK